MLQQIMKLATVMWKQNTSKYFFDNKCKDSNNAINEFRKHFLFFITTFILICFLEIVSECTFTSLQWNSEHFVFFVPGKSDLFFLLRKQICLNNNNVFFALKYQFILLCWTRNCLVLAVKFVLLLFSSGKPIESLSYTVIYCFSLIIFSIIQSKFD